MSHLRKYIFLIDGLGALASAITIGLVLPIFNVGLPPEILIGLASLALLFSSYSLSCHFFKKSKKWLIPIIFANSIYSLSTMALVLHYFQQLSLFGRAHFALDIVIIVTLVTFEIKILRDP